MKSIFCILSLFLLLNLSCSKNLDSSSNRPQVRFTLDGVQYSRVYGKDTTNAMTEMGYSVGSNNYYQVGSLFDFDNTSSHSLHISIAAVRNFGPLYYDSTYQSFKSNYSTGNKTFDHIQYVVTTDPGKVEIEYTDENGIEWSSTTYTHPNAGYTALINQPDGKFTITQLWESLDQYTQRKMLTVVGTFNCKLYQVNGPGVKDLRDGYFVAFAEMF